MAEVKKPTLANIVDLNNWPATVIVLGIEGKITSAKLESSNFYPQFEKKCWKRGDSPVQDNEMIQELQNQMSEAKKTTVDVCLFASMDMGDVKESMVQFHEHMSMISATNKFISGFDKMGKTFLIKNSKWKIDQYERFNLNEHATTIMIHSNVGIDLGTDTLDHSVAERDPHAPSLVPCVNEEHLSEGKVIMVLAKSYHQPLENCGWDTSAPKTYQCECGTAWSVQPPPVYPKHMKRLDPWEPYAFPTGRHTQNPDSRWPIGLTRT